jgi:aerobic C4-dicarboxylate transport protein
LYARLWFQVIVGIVVGVGLGYFYPAQGAAMKPLGDAFVKLIRMMIAPIIFGTVVVGIAKMGDMKEVDASAFAPGSTSRSSRRSR